MADLDRRTFLRRSASYATGLALAPSLSGLVACSRGAGMRDGAPRFARFESYGELIPSEDSPELLIPPGFRCIRLSRALEPMRGGGGGPVPNAFDGMASFPMPNGNVRLIRNHEVPDSARNAVPIGSRPYDARAGGGTTSLEVRIGGDAVPELVDEFVSLSGTSINCAGGPTPWGSWISCEETTEGETQGRLMDHGYCFEVPASAMSEIEAVPLKAMGRFVHEALAVDPQTGIVYLTEDALYSAERPDVLCGAGFYRFIPTRRGDLAAGGRLQMLAVAGRPRYNTITGQTPWTRLPAVWVDVDDPDPAAAEEDPYAVARAGQRAGGAIFQRLEGCFYGDRGIYFDATQGGNAGVGQVWQYRPTGRDSGDLTLIFESPGREVLDSPDNICTTPRGGLVICEDGRGEQFLRGLTRDGRIFDLVRTVAPGTEFCGSCFSPDYRVLFFNQQGSRSGRVGRGTVPGTTYALFGRWVEGAV
jgi:secreted PhoX family phosphatase